MMHWTWLDEVCEVLISEGFYATALQVVKPGQVFGLVKRLNDVWEMHVRGFDDGMLEAEIEVSREYLQHFNDRYRTDATDELTGILDSYGITYQILGSLPEITIQLEAPRALTPWKPLALLAGIGAFLLLVGLDRKQQSR